MEINATQLTTLVALASLVVAIMALSRNRKGDTAKEAAEQARVITRLDAIQNGIDDIRIDQKSLRKDLSELNTRVTRLEAETHHD